MFLNLFFPFRSETHIRRSSMARSLAPERLPVDVVAELDEVDRLVYKRLLVADEAEALHRFHVYVAAHQKRDHRPNSDRKSIVKSWRLAVGRRLDLPAVSGENCPICQEAVRLDQGAASVFVLECMHVLCTACMTGALEMGHARCPLCREGQPRGSRRLPRQAGTVAIGLADPALREAAELQARRAAAATGREQHLEAMRSAVVEDAPPEEAEAVRAAWVAELQSSQQRECAAESAADMRRKRRAADEARASSSDEEARVSAKRAVEAAARAEGADRWQQQALLQRYVEAVLALDGGGAARRTGHVPHSARLNGAYLRSVRVDAATAGLSAAVVAHGQYGEVAVRELLEARGLVRR